MWNYGPGPDILHGLGLLVVGLFWLVGLAVIAAVLVLLVRFLLVATTAAKLYVAKNSPATSAKPGTMPAATPSAPAPTAVAEPTATTAPKKPRTPKAPPAV